MIITMLNILHEGFFMNKKLIISKVVILLACVQSLLAMDNNNTILNKILFNDNLGRYFLEYFGNNENQDKDQFIWYLNMCDLRKNKPIYWKEKIFLNNFHVCYKITKLSTS